MQPKLLIKGGTLVTGDTCLEADILTQGETIQAIGKDLQVNNANPPDIIDASGMFVLPGIIDAHTHIQLDTGIYKTPDDWFTGSRAAAWGGVTTVVDFATQFQGQTFAEALENRLVESASSVIDYAFHMMVTDLPPGREDELGELIDLGIQSLKLYTTYRPNYYADDATLLRLLDTAARYGLTTLIHCENDDLVTAQTQALIDAGTVGWRYHGAARPALAEQEAAARVIFLAEAANAPIVIAHNSTARTTLLAAEARERGWPIYTETAPQYLLLDNRVYEGSEPWRYILQPPLRDPEEKARLWAVARDGLVDMIITDHCDYTKAQKLALNDFTQTPGGLPGLETLLPLMATYGVDEGHIDWPDLVNLLATNPAHIYNLWPRKGALLPGSDADIVIYNPTPDDVIHLDNQHTIAGYTPYEGLRVKGRVVTTIRRGQYLVHDGQFRGTKGSGHFIPRAPSD